MDVIDVTAAHLPSLSLTRVSASMSTQSHPAPPYYSRHKSQTAQSQTPDSAASNSSAPSPPPPQPRTSTGGYWRSTPGASIRRPSLLLFALLPWSRCHFPRRSRRHPSTPPQRGHTTSEPPGLAARRRRCAGAGARRRRLLRGVVAARGRARG